MCARTCAHVHAHTRAHLSASNYHHCRVQVSWICTVEKQIFLKHLLFRGWYWSQSTSLPQKCTLLNFYSFSLNGIIQFGHVLFAHLILAVFQSQMHMQRRNDSPLFRVFQGRSPAGLWRPEPPEVGSEQSWWPWGEKCRVTVSCGPGHICTCRLFRNKSCGFGVILAKSCSFFKMQREQPLRRQRDLK